MKKGCKFLIFFCAAGLLSSGISPKANAQTTMTVTIGSKSPDYGYVAGSYGSLSSATSADGHAITALYDFSTCGKITCFGSSVLSVGGFTADPGKTWLSSILLVATGKTLTEANATAYSYASGVSTWAWSGSTATTGLGFAAGSTTATVSLSLGGGAAGTILPKYQVVGLTYAPPGAKSTAAYSDGFQSGTSNTTTSSFKAGVTVATTVTAGVDLFGILNGATTNTFTAGWEQLQSSTNTATVADTYSTGLVVPGPLSSALGVDHDYDTVYIWLNPAVDLVVYPTGVDFVGYNWDARDTITGMDVVSLTIGQLRGTQAITDTTLKARLNRTWDSALGALTSVDFLAIAVSDPFYNTPSFNPNTDTSHRYELPNSQDLIFNYIPAAPGAQPTSETYTSSYTTTSTAGKSASTTYTLGYSVEGGASAAFLVALSGKIKVTNTFSYTSGWSSNITSGTSQAANFTIVPPLATDNYTGPTAMQVWKDNLYGTFMFYPEN
jgi:hypothetical protein